MPSDSQPSKSNHTKPDKSIAYKTSLIKESDPPKLSQRWIRLIHKVIYIYLQKLSVIFFSANGLAYLKYASLIYIVPASCGSARIAGYITKRLLFLE